MKPDLSSHVNTDHRASWACSIRDTIDALGSDSTYGLTMQDAFQRQVVYGRNQLQATRPRTFLSIAADQFKSSVIVLLAAAAIIAFLFSDHSEGIAILAVIVINGSIGFFTELRATRSMESLKVLGQVETSVIRDGIAQQIPAFDLVPGDIVLFEGGDVIAADIRLVHAAKLQANESTLTGESLPVTKQTDVLEFETLVMDRSNMVFKGTAIARGTGKGVVVSIGLNTELGRISALATAAESQQTPLERRLSILGGRLAIAVVIIAVFIAIAGVLSGRDTYLAIEVAVALAVAAIPEGLPIVATIALARGMRRMAQRNALIGKLSAVETLGATSVILTDKTGTLTENRMTVTAMRLAGMEQLLGREALSLHSRARSNGDQTDEKFSGLIDDLLTIAVLCNNASLQKSPDGKSHSVGDPTELALLGIALQRGVRRDDLIQSTPEITEVPFDPDTKLMATVHRMDANVLIAVKGAPESVIPICNSIRTLNGDSVFTETAREKWLEYATEIGERGLRTLAFARKVTSKFNGDPYDGLILLGIVGLEDPARAGVKSAINRCRDFGITVVMVTGDHLATARNIAEQVGIVEHSASPSVFVDGPELDNLLAPRRHSELARARVVSRTTPEQKLNIIDFYQQHGHVVAMTGDGVNDAPALKKADIGIAMGIRGTAVAKEASHMVLQDDEFGTIVEAVAQGRAIYENIRKFVVYLLSCNISEIFIIGIATVAGAPLPLLPLQILFLNLVTDVFPALALGVGEGPTSLIKRGPRPVNEPLLTKSHWIRIGVYGGVISVAVLSAMSIAMIGFQFEMKRAVTVSFCTLAFAQLWHVFNMRDDMRKIAGNEITGNIWIWFAIAICLALILIAIYTPVLSDILALTNPGIHGWLIILPMSLVPLFAGLLLPGSAQPEPISTKHQ